MPHPQDLQGPQHPHDLPLQSMHPSNGQSPANHQQQTIPPGPQQPHQPPAGHHHQPAQHPANGQDPDNQQSAQPGADLIEASISALLKLRVATPQDYHEILPKFSSHLKTDFENRNLWLRFGLTIQLSQESPQSALQAFNECMRIDQDDPLPAMLAAKLLLEQIDDPEQALSVATEAINRCKKQLLPEFKGTRCKNIAPILSRSYVLASVTHAYLYEREPISIRKLFKEANLKASLELLESAQETNPQDFLVYFHKALHEANQRTYPKAIDNLRRAIQINPHHMPSIQLLILSLSALKLHEDALTLCESILSEHVDDLMLLYIKCNLEQCLVETKGYKVALNTAQQMLKHIRQSSLRSNPAGDVKQTSNLFPDEKSSAIHKADILAGGELSVWLLVAEIFVKIGSVEDAESCVEEGSAQITGTLSHQIMYIQGLVAKARNQLDEAKSHFQSCLALCPKHARALQQMAHVHYLLGNHSTAEKFLRDSLDLEADCHKTWYYLSLVYIEMNQHDRANECVKKSTTLEETSPPVPFSTISRLTLQ